MRTKHQQFAAEYIVDLNAAHAAIRAGYSARTSRQIGFELLGRPDVQAAVAKAMEERSARVKVDADWLLDHLAQEAKADLADLYDENDNLKPIRNWPKIWRQGLVAGVEVEELFEGRGEEREHIGRIRKVKLADRTRIKELIGKHVDVRAFIERKEITGKDGGPIITTDMTAKEAAEIYRDELG